MNEQWQELKETIIEMRDNDGIGTQQEVCKFLANLMDVLEEQQPKTGKWEYVQYDYNPNLGNWHCSECRNIVIECVNKNDKGGIPIYNYCPNCGARMEVIT